MKKSLLITLGLTACAVQSNVLISSNYVDLPTASHSYQVSASSNVQNIA